MSNPVGEFLCVLCVYDVIARRISRPQCLGPRWQPLVVRDGEQQ